MYCLISTPILMLLIVVPLVSTEEGLVCEMVQLDDDTTGDFGGQAYFSLSGELAVTEADCKHTCLAIDDCAIMVYVDGECHFFTDLGHTADKETDEPLVSFKKDCSAGNGEDDNAGMAVVSSWSGMMVAMALTLYLIY